MRWTQALAAIAAAWLTAGAASAQTAVDLAVENALGCARYDDGSVYCWGGLPGEFQFVPATAWKVEGLPPARSVTVGPLGGCAVTRDRALWCWGIDVQATLPAEKLVTSRTPFRVKWLPEVSAAAIGVEHKCALSWDGGRVWCWGLNSCGQLGCGDFEPREVPTRVPFIYDAISLSTGVNNTCVAMIDGTVSCWGSDDPAYPDSPGFAYSSPDPMVFSSEAMAPIRQVANGRNFACGRREDGRVTCWGSNIFGQIGTSDPRLAEGPAGIGEVEGLTAAEDLDATYFNACAVQAGKVLCWGLHPMFETFEEPDYMTAKVITVPGIEGATRVGIGEDFACAIADGRVLCWGWQNYDGKVLVAGMAPDNPVPIPGLPGEAAADTVETHPFADLAVARDLLFQGAFAEALELAQLLRADDPGNPEVRAFLPEIHFAIGEAHADAGEDDAALAAFDEARRLALPLADDGADTARLLLVRIDFERARAFQNLGRFDAALEALARSWQVLDPLLSAAPTDEVLRLLARRIHQETGRAYEESERYEEAITAYRAALDLDPDLDLAHWRLGLVLQTTGAIAEAIAEYEAVLEIQPGDGTVQNQLAWVLATTPLAEHRDPARAVALAQAAVAENPTGARYDTLGAAWLAAGNAAEALAAYREAAKAGGDYAEALAGQLRYLGYLAAGAAQDPAAFDTALAACVTAGHPPFALAENIAAARRIAGTDPTLARRFLAGLRAVYPDHPDVISLVAAAENWPAE